MPRSTLLLTQPPEKCDCGCACCVVVTVQPRLEKRDTVPGPQRSVPTSGEYPITAAAGKTTSHHAPVLSRHAVGGMQAEDGRVAGLGVSL